MIVFNIHPPTYKIKYKQVSQDVKFTPWAHNLLSTPYFLLSPAFKEPYYLSGLLYRLMDAFDMGIIGFMGEN